MKKTLIALAALAATGAFAQVSVYGRLDVGYAATTNTSNGADTKDNGVVSHNSVSSMWGIQGSEDLGGGLKANFKLEQDIYTANGNVGVSGSSAGAGASGTVNGAASSTNIGFNRTSLLGLSGGFGTVSLGRDYVPTFKLIGATDVNNLSRIDTVQLAANTGVSTTNSVVFYSTPVMSGFQVNVAYRNADQSTTTDTFQKLTNITATYTNGPLMVGVGTGSTESKAAGVKNTGVSYTGQAAVTTAEKVSGNVVAGSYDFGSFKLMGNYITSKAQEVTAGVDNEQTELNIGATVPMGKATLIAQAGQNVLKVTGADDRKGTDFVLGVDYALSAKTAVFAKTGTYAKMDAAAGGGEYKSVSTAVGLKTVF